MRIFIGLLLLFPLCIRAQTITPVEICTFPDSIHESSGLLFIDSSHVLTHNDSGDSARLFLYNYSSCSVEKTIVIRDHIAKDIEAITMDDSGFVYVADMGNNLANRTDLCIMKIKLDDVLNEDTVIALYIYFNYGDQLSFNNDTNNFDCEAMVHHNDTLFLFSKNHFINGTYTKRYVLPDLPGTYTINPLDSFQLSTWVTDAALDPNHKKLVLTSESKLYVFELYGSVRLDSLEQTFNYSFITQKEGITFKDSIHLYLTDEKVLSFGGKLYTIDISSWDGIKENPLQNLTILHNNEELSFTNSFLFDVSIEIILMDGRILSRDIIYPGEKFKMKPDFRGILRIMGNDYITNIKF